jgi:hypothetical protein
MNTRLKSPDKVLRSVAFVFLAFAVLGCSGAPTANPVQAPKEAASVREGKSTSTDADAPIQTTLEELYKAFLRDAAGADVDFGHGKVICFPFRLLPEYSRIETDEADKYLGVFVPLRTGAQPPDGGVAMMFDKKCAPRVLNGETLNIAAKINVWIGTPVRIRQDALLLDCTIRDSGIPFPSKSRPSPPTEKQSPLPPPPLPTEKR